MSASDFETFWKAYPRKVGKDAAEKAWIKKKPNIDEVLNSLLWQMQTDQWKAESGKFIPHPSTYLNQGRWKDEPPPVQEAQINIRNKGHAMTDEQFVNWLTGATSGRLA